MNDDVERGINGEVYGEPRNNFRYRQRIAVREIDRHRVRKMAHAAVLVFECPAVPVSRGLKAEGQHRNSHENDQQPACCTAGDIHYHPPFIDFVPKI
jgi:hypothetical protein